MKILYKFPDCLISENHVMVNVSGMLRDVTKIKNSEISPYLYTLHV